MGLSLTLIVSDTGTSKVEVKGQNEGQVVGKGPGPVTLQCNVVEDTQPQVVNVVCCK